jgi:cystathionine beta-lyase/cystathionine gamma-synthase
MTDSSTLEPLIKDNTKLIFLETPTNPNLKSGDIEEIAKLAKKHNCLLAVDNTFMTPML